MKDNESILVNIVERAMLAVFLYILLAFAQPVIGNEVSDIGRTAVVFGAIAGVVKETRWLGNWVMFIGFTFSFLSILI